MPIIPAAAPLTAPALTFFIARSSRFPLCITNSPAPLTSSKPNGRDALPKFSGDWLYAEDEYFPFDADSFEER